MIFDARKVSRRWSRCTFVAKRVRYSASSNAVSPPPTTAISRSRKKNPSHVAQARHAAPAKAGLALEVEPERRGSGRDDDGLAPVLDAARPDPERPPREVHAIDVDVDDARPEALRLGAHRGHEVRPLDAVGEARVVLDVAGDHQLAAGRGTGEHDRLEVGAGRVDRGGQAGRPGAHDDELGLDGTIGRAVRGGSAGRGRRGPRTRPAESSTIAMLKPPNGLVVGGVAPSFSSLVMASSYHAGHTPWGYPGGLASSTPWRADTARFRGREGAG